MRVTEEIVGKLGALYKERLESELVSELSRRLEVDATTAMTTYYSSDLARQVDEGTNGIQYLSPSYLVDELLAELGIDEPAIASPAAEARDK